MIHSLFQAICRVGIFMICAQALLHFRAQDTYEKYLKLLVSIMILLQLFLPVGMFFSGGNGETAAEALKQFEREMEESIREVEENAAAVDAVLEQMTLREVQGLLEAEQESPEAEQEDSGTKPQDGEVQPEENGTADTEGEDTQGVKDIEPISIEPVSVGAGEENE